MYKELYLMLTTDCPNRCKYCYIKHNKEKASMTSKEAILQIEKYKPDRVIMFGGEPLLKLDVIKDIYGVYGDTAFTPKFQIVTSTSVNFKEFIDFQLETHMFNEIQLSWDGYQSDRISATNEITGNKTIENINYAISKKIPFDIKCVISEGNIDELENIHNIFLNLAKDKSNKVSGQFVIAHRDYYSEEFFTKLEKLLPKTFTMERLYKDHLNKIIAYLQKDINYSNCDAGKYIVVTPDGRESYCTALSQNYDVDFSEQELQEPCLHEDCNKCIYRFLCDGGCRYERYNKYGDMWKYNYLPSTCRIVKIYYNTIRNFINSLSSNDLQKLYETIERYKNYQRKYHACHND